MMREEADEMVEKWSKWVKENESYDLETAYLSIPYEYHHAALLLMHNGQVISVYTDAKHFNSVREQAMMIEAQQAL